MMSAAGGDGIAAEPFCFYPAEAFAVEGLYLYPAVLDLHGSDGCFLLDGIDDTGVCLGFAAQLEMLTAVVAGAAADAGVVHPIACG